uniref:Ig-like domain-containing protein n=1 Tax=Seriola lalandi dorsalis TaxID=1841481 RepID=A0A3B4XZ03_SERLL
LDSSLPLHVLFFPECKGEDRVIQPTADVTAAEGDTVTLDCSFETSDTSNAYLFWYKQEENDFPKYVLRRDSYGTISNAPDFTEERFNATIKNKTVPLKIQKLQVSDSAVYYCALRPTVTGNTKTLTVQYTNHQHYLYSTCCHWTIMYCLYCLSLL